MQRALKWDEFAGNLTGMAYLATADADGTPHVAIVSAAIEGQTIWVLTDKNSAKALNAKANGKVAIVWSAGAEAYIWGDAEVLGDQQTKSHVWNSGLLDYDPVMFFQEETNPEMCAIKITPTLAMLQTMVDTVPSRRRWRPSR